MDYHRTGLSKLRTTIKRLNGIDKNAKIYVGVDEKRNNVKLKNNDAIEEEKIESTRGR